MKAFIILEGQVFPISRVYSITTDLLSKVEGIVTEEGDEECYGVYVWLEAGTKLGVYPIIRYLTKGEGEDMVRYFLNNLNKAKFDPDFARDAEFYADKYKIKARILKRLEEEVAKREAAKEVAKKEDDVIAGPWGMLESLSDWEPKLKQ